MRGQKLFIRPLEPADYKSVTAFLTLHGSQSSTPSMGIIGKLVGDLVAVAFFGLAGDALRVEQLVVAKELRRKRIGRFMLGELEQLARKMERRRLIVDDAGDAAEFLRRVGFHDEGGSMVREIR